MCLQGVCGHEVPDPCRYLHDPLSSGIRVSAQVGQEAALLCLPLPGGCEHECSWGWSPLTTWALCSSAPPNWSAPQPFREVQCLFLYLEECGQV